MPTCPVLASIAIPSSVTSLGNYAFNLCVSLTSIVISASVTAIGTGAFASCHSLNIYCEATSTPTGWNSDWNSNGGTAYWYSETEKTGYWHYVNGVPTLW